MAQIKELIEPNLGDTMYVAFFCSVLFICFNSRTQQAQKVAMNKSPGKQRATAIRQGGQQGQDYFKNRKALSPQQLEDNTWLLDSSGRQVQT